MLAPVCIASGKLCNLTPVCGGLADSESGDLRSKLLVQSKHNNDAQTVSKFSKFNLENILWAREAFKLLELNLVVSKLTYWNLFNSEIWQYSVLILGT